MKKSRFPVLLFLAFFFIRLALAEPEEIIRSRIKRRPVVSTNVASVGYSRELHALEIEFVRGAIYRFLNVPPVVYRDFLASPSKGHFIAERLRGKFAFVRVQPRRSENREKAKSASRPP